MGTETFSYPSSETEVIKSYYPREGDEYNFSGNFVKCMKCNNIYSFISRCSNCSNDKFITSYTGAMACAKCGNLYEYWICGSNNCNCTNPLRETFLKKGKEGSCFIATAVYGNYNAPEVIVLRQFRDNYLVKKRLTNTLVSLYYWISPAIAIYVSQHNKIKCTTRRLLDHFVASKYVKK